MKRLIEWFENKVVLAISHWFYLVLAGLMGLGFAGSILLMAYGAIPPIKGPAPKPIQEPPEIKVKHDKIRAELERIKAEEESKKIAQAEKKNLVQEKASEITVEDKLAPSPPSDQELIKAKIEQLHKFFPGKGFPWDNQVSSYCVETDWWYGHCIRWKSKVEKYGARHLLNELAEMAEDTEKALVLMDDIAKLLESVDTENGYSALRLYYNDYQDQKSAREKFIIQENERFQSEYAQRERDYLEAREKKATYRRFALMGMGGAFASFAILGLFLAILAVERNTRALEELIKRLKENPLKE
jgi:hypothetical protein